MNIENAVELGPVTPRGFVSLNDGAKRRTQRSRAENLTITWRVKIISYEIP